MIISKVSISGSVSISSASVWAGDQSNGTSMPAVRVQPITASYSGKLYILGGAAGTTSYSTFWEYNPSTTSYTSLTSTSYSFYYGAGCIGSNYLYTNGGKVFGTSVDPVATTRRYNFNTSTWETLTSAPKALWLHASYFYNGKFYLWGGSTLNNNTVASQNKDTLVYDPSLNSWSTITAPATAPSARGQFSHALIGDYFYIMGGYTNVGSNESWRYHIPSNTWTKLGNLPITTYGGFGFTIDGRLFFTSGSPGSGTVPNQNIYEYSFSNNTWSVFRTFPDVNWNPGVAFLDRTLYVCGGTPNSTVAAGVSTVKLLK